MLEIRNLTKIYRPKKGVPVTAIDHVSLRFPETGMVFLLGKSGSGKSTLLNLLGGLDRFDDGEILIKGASSRDFHQQHFDAYRNTYVGFIFQEYNVLEDFNVGANIALAIELQGKKATDEQINAILREVDLEGYGARRPNELSGGQKQRVAIARALVKQPRIIMADEPTGALDSATGRQILDTLKKLSRERLAIVVSHDREFAEQYADRIIELADGRVISDTTYSVEDATEDATEDAAKETGLTYVDDTVRIAPGYHLTEEDRAAINAYIDRLQSGVTLCAGQPAAPRHAAPTDQAAITMDNTGFSLIRSRLPMRSAAKIGVSSLKHKKFRLAITILLSCISFGLFGLSDTFGSYNHIRACTDSLIDTGISYASVGKSRAMGEDGNYFRDGYHISDADITAIKENTGVPMQGVYQPLGWNLFFDNQLAPEEAINYDTPTLLATYFNGITETDEDTLREMGYTLLAGTLPDGNKDEIAISTYVAQTFIRFRYKNGDGNAVTVPDEAAMVGKTLTIGGKDFTVTGVIDTKFDFSRYAVLQEEPTEPLTTAQRLIRYALESEWQFAASSSLHCTAFTGKGYLSRLDSQLPSVRDLNHNFIYFMGSNGNWLLDPHMVGRLSDLKDTKVIWLDGQPRTSLGEKELVISTDMIYMTDKDGNITDEKINWLDPTVAKEAIAAWQKNARDIVESSPRTGRESNDSSAGGYTVVGYIDPADAMADTLTGTIITGNELFAYLTDGDEGPYSFAIGPMPSARAEVQRLVSYCYTVRDGARYELKSAATYELDIINSLLETLSRVFLYIGCGFAVFAAIMLANFISTSITYKKQEIGILRAIGSRSNDVFRIFFSESFVIAAINFLLSFVGVAVVTAAINRYIRNELNVLVTVLHCGVRQGVLLLCISLCVAALASFFPVRHIAAKRPIDAIRNR